MSEKTLKHPGYPDSMSGSERAMNAPQGCNQFHPTAGVRCELPLGHAGKCLNYTGRWDPEEPVPQVVNGFDIRATLRRVLPEGSTIWTVTQHVTRSSRVTILPMAFFADLEDPKGASGGYLYGGRIASRRYVLGREFCEKLGYRWDDQHRGWIGNYGEDASGSIVAALSMAAYDRPDAYSLGRTS